MVAINWLVLVLAVMLPVSFALGRKVEREVVAKEIERRVRLARKAQDQYLTRQYFD